MNTFRKHLHSYIHACRGITIAFRFEPNMRLHFIGAIAVMLINIFLQISRGEWITTGGLIALVFMAEIFNTAIEKLSDRVTKQHDPLIRDVKDLAAGAVLIICLFAVVCAVIIYVPYIIE